MTIAVPTATERVYEELRRRIVRHELFPQTPLPLTELADELGVSTMPVRAALSALQAEGLIQQARHRGATVAALGLADLELIQAVRSGIEGLAAEAGAGGLSSEHATQVGASYSRCQKIAVAGGVDTYLTCQWEMHDICYRAAARPQLLELIHQYRRRAERYIRLALGEDELAANLALEERFVFACMRRDGAGAREAICAALAWTVEALTPILAQRASGSVLPVRAGPVAP